MFTECWLPHLQVPQKPDQSTRARSQNYCVSCCIYILSLLLLALKILETWLMMRLMMKAMTIYQQLHQLTLRTSSHNYKTTLQKNEIPLEISEKKNLPPYG